MDEFKGRWQAQQSEDAGSRLVGGTLARSVAECFMAGYQLALDRTFHLQDTRWGALAVSEGFEGHPPVTVDGESALAGSKTWVPGAPYIDTVMIRVGRGRDAMFVQIDLPCGGVTSALREKDGFLDDLEIDQIKPFCSSLLSYLDSAKPAYGSAVRDTKKFESATEEILKDLELYIRSLDKKENHLVDTVPSLISAKRPANIKSLRDKLANSLPEGPFLFGEDELTDKSQKFVASEMIREQVFRQLGDEIPYGITVVVDSIEFRRNIHFLDATIVVEREAHKPIVIGAKGARIKKLGENSRDTLERHFETQVMLNLFVKVQSNWINNDKLINELQGIIESETL